MTDTGTRPTEAHFNVGSHPIYWVVLGLVAAWLLLTLVIVLIIGELSAALLLVAPGFILTGIVLGRLLQPRPVTIDLARGVVRRRGTEVPFSAIVEFRVRAARGGWWLELRGPKRRLAQLILHWNVCRPVTPDHYRAIHDALLAASRAPGTPPGSPAQRDRNGDLIPAEQALPMLRAQADWIETGGAPVSTGSPLAAMMMA